MVGLKRYPYGEDFQDKAAALLIRDRAFLQNHGTLVKHEYFDNEYVRVVVRLVLDYYFETNDPPTREKVGVMITDFCNANKSGSPEYGEMLRGVLNAVWGADLTGAQQIADTMIEFGRTREMEALARQLAEGVMSGEKPDKLWNLIDRSRTSLALPVEDEMDIAASFVDAQEIAMRSGLYNPALKIKTMIPTLDDCSNGGLGRKEVGIVLAPTGVGKSTLLVNFGLGAILQRAPVLHFSVTELETVDLLVRYAARATGFISNDIAAGTAGQAFKDKMRNFNEKHNPQIVAQRVPIGTSVSSLRSLINRWMFQRGLTPGLIIVDNADDLSSRLRKEEAYDEKGEIYAELKDLAHDFNCALWTDSQTNRFGGSADMVKLEHIADSHKKARKADLIIALSQNEQESEAGYARIKMLKARRTKKNLATIRVCFDGARMTVREAVGEAAAA